MSSAEPHVSAALTDAYVLALKVARGMRAAERRRQRTLALRARRERLALEWVRAHVPRGQMPLPLFACTPAPRRPARA